jgi:hypothetical protein
MRCSPPGRCGASNHAIRRSRAVRLGLLFTCLFSGVASNARADWLITPFIGSTFGADSAYPGISSDTTTAKHLTFGASAGWLSGEIFGAEADLAFVPRIFQSRSATNVVTSSRATTLFGNVVAAVPVRVTRESLRPYVLGGVGLVHLHIQDAVGFVDPNESSLGLQVGGGAIGFLSERAGVRFDLRHVRTLSRTTNARGERQSKLEFWRAAIGVVVRY